MPARLAPQGISTHPQLQKMIESFIAGISAREIARWADPPVAHNTISRYMRARVIPALKNAGRLLTIDPPRNGSFPREPMKKKHHKQQVAIRQTDRSPAEQLATEALVAAPVLSLFRQRLEKLNGRVDRALDRAETAVRVVDREGTLVAAGADLSPIAPLLSQAHKNLEMLGRATGELEPQNGQNLMSIRIVCPALGQGPGAPHIAYGRDNYGASDESATAVIEEIIGVGRQRL